MVKSRPSGSVKNIDSQCCHFHPENEAVYQCGGCLKKLCPQCITQDAHLYFCSHCGEQARLMITPAEPISVKEIASTASGVLGDLMSLATNHILVPAAIIIMVGAFLFFLLDIRSVFLGDSSSLKRVGFCFAAATVLIARYGKVYGDRARQMTYTLLLGGATLIAMSRYSTGGVNVIVNLTIIAAVWRFASGVTNNLHLVEEERKKDEHRLYGVERIHHEELERKHGLKADRYAPREKPDKKKKKPPGKQWDAHGNPSAAVAKFVVLAIITFALGEPLILSGPPQVGLRALAAVIVFLLSAGIVLAASSALGTYRHTIRSGGSASLGMVPVKIFIGLLLMVTILAAAITFPGIKYRGSGKIHPTRYRTTGHISGNEDNKSKTASETREAQKASEKQADKEGKGGNDSRGSGGQNAPQTIFNFFATLGRLLLIPLALIFLGLVIYALIKLWPNLKSWRLGIKDRLANLLDKLKSLFHRRRKRKEDAVPAKTNPLDLLSTIKDLPPRQAILLAYSCLLAFLEGLGHNRSLRLTPYEYLYSLPRQLDYLAEPAGKLTQVYVMTAYSQDSPTSDDSEKALAALFKVQHLIESRRNIQ